jgi:hypothetical protein
VGDVAGAEGGDRVALVMEVILLLPVVVVEVLLALVAADGVLVRGAIGPACCTLRTPRRRLSSQHALEARYWWLLRHALSRGRIKAFGMQLGIDLHDHDRSSDGHRMGVKDRRATRPGLKLSRQHHTT